MSSRRQTLKAKIAGLRAKTRANGCTEAEALAAAELAAKLMAEAGLTEDDIELTEAEAYDKTVRATWRSDLAAEIAHVTSTAVIVIQDPHRQGTIHLFIGEDPRPEIAVYLLDVLFRAVEGEVRAFKASTFYRRRRSLATKRAAVQDFVDGLVSRLRSRLRELFCSTMSATALEKAKRALAARFPECQDFARPERDTRFGDARHAGWQAGGNVALNHGVGGGRPDPLRLEGGHR